jgi:predicted Rossmann fold flavoprotein
MKTLISKKSLSYDVVVVGAGAAGLVAAITTARGGGQVLLLEKNAIVGKKLRITGGGRCNITNNTPNVRELLSKYQEAGKFLFSPFAQFGVAETVTWFADIGVPVVEEAERRMFPVSQSAVAVTEALLATAKRVGVTIKTKSAVSGVKKGPEGLVVTLGDGTSIMAKRVIVATGGVSRPETGSTGDALPWLQALGHTTLAPRSALVPIGLVNVALARRLSGVALPEVGIKLRQYDKIVEKSKGKVLFTHEGMSGPGILNLSERIGALLDEGPVDLLLDLVPTLAVDALEQTLLERFIASPNKLVRNQWHDLIPGALVVPLLEAALVPETTPSHSVTVEMRRRLVATAKAFKLAVSHLLGSDKAVVSAGGVALPEVDFKTMESRLVPGLYIIGDVLNINRPSGGYSLQLCWTTGYVAGRAVLEKTDEQ